MPHLTPVLRPSSPVYGNVGIGVRKRSEWLYENDRRPRRGSRARAARRPRGGERDGGRPRSIDTPMLATLPPPDPGRFCGVAVK